MTQESYLITNVLIPTNGEEEKGGTPGYGRFHVAVSAGKISAVDPATSPPPTPEPGTRVIDGTERMLLPGFVNGHTHSTQQWGRGCIKPLPLELWVDMMYQNVNRQPVKEPFPRAKVYFGALHAGVETMMSGGTAIMDHLFCRDLDDVEAAVRAYKECGIRAFIAPMLADMDRLNYYPLVPDAAARNLKHREDGSTPGAMGEGGYFRETLASRVEEETERVFSLWREAVEKFHDPENGINIAIGPVAQWCASDELIRRTVELRRQHNLCGHIHCLETRAQKMLSRQMFPDGGAVKNLFDQGWLQLPGTSLAHGVWLEEAEQKLISESGAVVIHNPVSNCRLGSGIPPLREYLNNGVAVAFGCDGACSNDAQDLLEAMKLGCILNPLTSGDYREWVTPREVVRMAAQGGARSVNMQGQSGEIKTGLQADMVLYDLTSLAMLPRTDPVGLLVLGRPCSGARGSTVHTVFVRGRMVIEDGVPCHVDLKSLRENLLNMRDDYIDPEITDCHSMPCEVEYRAALGLSGPQGEHNWRVTEEFPCFRLNYETKIP